MTTQPHRIVIVDDHTLMRNGLRLFIQQETEFEVVGEAARADEAFAAIESAQPEIVLMDVQLEHSDGIELSGRMLEQWPHLKILILSAFGTSEMVGAALQAGTRGFLVKTNAGDELLRALRAVAEGGSYFCPIASAAIVKNYETPAANATRKGAAANVTPRERDVWKLTAEGLRVKEIATRLNIGVKTVETHRAQLLRKLNCSGTAELTRCAIKEGICAL